MDSLAQLPPPALSARVGGTQDDYHVIGNYHATWIRDLLPDDWNWSGKRILDFGSGPGRTLVQFEQEAREAEFWGCDIDAPTIEWASRNLSPPFHFLLNRELPPLDFPDARFDLIYGMSVFTHLVETWSAWLLEMHRLLEVGGYAVFTFLGEGMIRDVAGREWDGDRVGMIGLDVGRPWAIGGPNALHSEWWLRAHWGRAFEVVSVEPYGDVANRYGHGRILLRKDGRPTPGTDELERLEPGEPREIAALQLNVELLKERTANLWATVDALQGITTSKSSRVTARLRRLRATASRRA